MSGQPVVVGPAPALGFFWADASGTFDFAPLGMTLSDGGRWTRDPVPPRLEFSAGLGYRRLAAGLRLGRGSVGIEAQLDVIRRGERRGAITAAAGLTFGGGWDLSIVPAYDARVASGRWGRLVAFGAVRLRWAVTLHDVQGWSDDRSSPFATASTRDVGLAPMAGVAIVWTHAEVRLTAGWETLLVDEVEWEDRPTALSRSGGAFAVVAVRGKLGGRLP